MIVRVTYLVDDVEKIYDLVSVRHIQENLAHKILAIEVNDADKKNSSEALSEMMNNEIQKIELIEGEEIIDFYYYKRLNVVNRVYYNESNDQDGASLRLQFLAEDTPTPAPNIK